jgi:hypothetical protein
VFLRGNDAGKGNSNKEQYSATGGEKEKMKKLAIKLILRGQKKQVSVRTE